MKLYAKIETDRGKNIEGKGGDKWIEIDLFVGAERIGRVILDHQGGKEWDLSYEKNDGRPSRVIDTHEGGITDGVTYACDVCGREEIWTAKDFADNGEPVCPQDDSDMKPIIYVEKKKHDPRTCENSVPCYDCERLEGKKRKGECGQFEGSSFNCKNCGSSLSNHK